MKTFNEFINEGNQFLRSIKKDDEAVAEKTFGNLKNGDIIYMFVAKEPYVIRFFYVPSDNIAKLFGAYSDAPLADVYRKNSKEENDELLDSSFYIDEETDNNHCAIYSTSIDDLAKYIERNYGKLARIENFYFTDEMYYTVESFKKENRIK